MPTNVIAAIARVEAEVGGIAKLTPEERRRRTGQPAGDGDDRGVKYAFRSIDQITAAAQPLLGKYGVVIVPERIDRLDVTEITVNSKPWTDTSIRVDWRIYGPGGVDDCITAQTPGLGRDNSDKGYNKAVTSAYKNLLLRLLTIGDPDDDPDTERHERDAHTSSGRRRRADPAAADIQRVYARVAEVAADSTLAPLLGEFGRANGGKRFDSDSLADDEWRAKVDAEIDRILGQVDAPADDDESLGDALAEALTDEPDDDHLDGAGY